MSLKDCDAIFKVMSDLMPKYDGNRKTLNYYIREVDNLLALVDDISRRHPALLCLIKNRLSGQAIDAIAYEDSLDSWEAIKSVLIRRLGEPRNEIQVMQELTRMRRFKSENAESFGKRLREVLDILYSIGKHTDKSYYENMVIEQYVNQLEFNVSIGVRIAKPLTLESAIVAARQEEARLSFNRNVNYNYNNMPFMPQAKLREPNFPQFSNQNQLRQVNSIPQRFQLNSPQIPYNNNHFVNNQPLYNNNNRNPLQRLITPNFVPKPNNMSPEQRQQLINSLLPWKNRPGNFNNKPNMPQKPNNQTRSVSDATMRAVGKPRSNFLSEELFYSPDEQYAVRECNQPDYEDYVL